MKEIDLKLNLYELTEEYPELIDILKNMGFFGVANPVVRNSLARMTTLPQGCVKQGKDLGEVLNELRAHGFVAKE